jgi:hypothetical protein
VQIAFQPVWIAKGRHAFLIEVVHPVEPHADEQAWRIMEATRSTSLIISTFSLEGKLLAQNPAATGVYGPLGDNTAQRLTNRFLDPSVARHILARVADKEKLSWEVEVNTKFGQRTHLIAAQRGRDPVTGDYIAVLSEENVTELAALRKMQDSVN